MIGRLVGIVRRPRATFLAVAAAPAWLGPLMVLFLINAGVNAVFLSTTVGEQALVDQWERTALAFGQEVDDARYAEFKDLSRRGATYGALIQLARGPVAAVILAGVLLVAFGRQNASYRQVLAVVVYSTVILTVRELVAAPVSYARESMASSTTLIQIFPVSNASSPLARVFGLLDLFVAWWLTVLAIGLSVIYARRAWPIAAALYGVYAGVAVGLGVTMAVLGGTI